MERITMTKYGFIRSKEDDFSDDGNRFTCYRVGKVRVSKLVSEGEAYIDAYIDSGLLPYAVYSKLPHYLNLGILNGVSASSITEYDLQKLYEDCISYEKEYDDAYNSINWPSEKEIADKAREFYADFEAVYKELEAELQAKLTNFMLKCSQSDWTKLRDYIISFRREFENYADPASVATRDFNQVRSLDFVKKTPNAKDNFWVRHIREILSKYS